jgi:hypothetical protein
MCFIVCRTNSKLEHVIFTTIYLAGAENIDNPDEMALFIRSFSKMMSKQKFFKGVKKDKFRTRTKRSCYNCGKYSHYIANCPHEHKDKEDDEKKKKEKKEKSYKMGKHYKKKTYGEAHISKEWDSDDESSDSDSDGVATMAIQGSSSSSSKPHFPNLNNGKHTCLMAKESKRKVKSKTSPPKYVSSDDELDSSDEENEHEEALVNEHEEVKLDFVINFLSNKRSCLSKRKKQSRAQEVVET